MMDLITRGQVARATLRQFAPLCELEAVARLVRTGFPDDVHIHNGDFPYPIRNQDVVNMVNIWLIYGYAHYCYETIIPDLVAG